MASREKINGENQSKKTNKLPEKLSDKYVTYKHKKTGLIQRLTIAKEKELLSKGALLYFTKV